MCNFSLYNFNNKFFDYRLENIIILKITVEKSRNNKI